MTSHDGRMPSKGARDPVECGHGVFLGKCRQAARGGKRAGTFSDDRRALLDRLVPGWDAPMRPGRKAR